ncbi:HAD-IA family hydrolase [Salinicola halophilus]|uniref:HAD-IA family hydrolase n=1 Tax=Salinicola halophilus TaxID=184065 RepID=UPI000DA24CC2|nr:HAD-IA family hydrolase [Salinicola halophilus]
MKETSTPRALLFDLDGTLVDTAPDLAEATNRLREHHGLARLPFETLRAKVSQGGSALVSLALSIDADHPDHLAARDYLLNRYAEIVADESQIFPGLAPFLERWEMAERGWGIVTNKPRRFAEPLIAALGLTPGVMICADDLPVRKPDPRPLLEAATVLGVIPGDCWYVGDHRRDMQAARAAGMPAIAVSYGYLDDADPVESWPADRWFDTPAELIAALWIPVDEAESVVNR